MGKHASFSFHHFATAAYFFCAFPMSWDFIYFFKFHVFCSHKGFCPREHAALHQKCIHFWCNAELRASKKRLVHFVFLCRNCSLQRVVKKMPPTAMCYSFSKILARCWTNKQFQKNNMHTGYYRYLQRGWRCFSLQSGAVLLHQLITRQYGNNKNPKLLFCVAAVSWALLRAGHLDN